MPRHRFHHGRYGLRVNLRRMVRGRRRCILPGYVRRAVSLDGPPMPAVVRLGTCSWADAGLLAAWYPRGVSTAEKRLRYYAERFDVVEVDSPYYALPDPAVTERWARRTPDGSRSTSRRRRR